MGHKARSKRGKKKRRKRKRRVTSCVRSILCCFSGTNISDASDEEDSEETGHRHEIVHNQESGHYGKKEIFNETVSGERGQREESHPGDRKNVQVTGNISTEVSERTAKTLREKDLDLAHSDREDLKTNSEQDTKINSEDKAVAFCETSTASEDKGGSRGEDLCEDKVGSRGEVKDASLDKDLVEDRGASLDEDLGEYKDASLDKELYEDKGASLDEDLGEDKGASLGEDVGEDNGEQEKEDCNKENTLEDNDFSSDKPNDASEFKGDIFEEMLGEDKDEQKEIASDEITKMEKDEHTYNDLETDEETMYRAEIENELYEIKRDASPTQRNDCKAIRAWKKMKTYLTDTEIALLSSIMDVNKRKFTLSFPTDSKFTDAVARHCSSVGLVTLKVYLPRNLQLHTELMPYNRPNTSKRQINYSAEDMFLPRASVKAPNNLQRPLVSFIPEKKACQQFVEIMVIAFELFHRNQPQMQGNPRIKEIRKDMVVEVESDRSSAQTDGDAAIDEETKTDRNERDTGNALASCGTATKRTFNRKISVSMFLRGSIRNHKMEAAVAVHCSRLGLILLQVDQLHAFQLRRILASYLRARVRKSLKFCAYDFHFPEAAVLDLAMQQMPTQEVLAFSESRPSATHTFIYTTVSFFLENQSQVKWLSCQQVVKNISADSYFLGTKSFLESQEVRTQIVKSMQRPRGIQNVEYNKTQPLIEEISMQHQEFPRVTCTEIVFAHLKKEQLNANLNRRVFAILRLSAFKLRDSIVSAIAAQSLNLGLIVLQIPSPRTEVVVTQKPSTKRMKATHLQTSVQVKQAKSYSVQAGKCLYQRLDETEKYLNYQEGKRMCSAIGMKHCNIVNESYRKNNASLKTREIENVLYEEVEGDASFRSVTKESEDYQLSDPVLNAPYGVHMTKRQLVNCIEDRAVPGEVAAALVLHFVSTKTKIKDYLQAAVKDLVEQEQESRKTDDQAQNELLTGPDGVELDGRAADVHPDDSIKPDTDVSSDTTECERESSGLNECEKKSIGSKRRRKRKKKRKHYGWHSP